MSRLPRWLALGSLTGGTFAVVILASAPASAEPSDWCSSGAAAPCIVSVTHGTAPVLPTDAVWQVDLSESIPGHDVMWNLKQNGVYELDSGSAGRWTVVIDTGIVVPRVVYGNGRHGAVVRTDDGDGTHQVSVSAEPTLVVEGCDSSPFPWPCPETATAEALRFGGQVTDWTNWVDPVQRDAFHGVDFWTNVTTNSFPPGVVYDDGTGIAEMRLDLAAPHFRTDGSTVFHGHFETVLPNDFLRENFFIPNPATMTTSSLAVAGGGPVSTTTLTKASPASPMEIEVTDMTFTVRTLRVRTGVVVPTRPRDLRARRVSAHVGRVGYDLASPRGARVTGYRARCESPGGHVRSASRSGNDSPLEVRELRRGVAYSCRVRALSKVGPGPWSTAVKVPRRP